MINLLTVCSRMGVTSELRLAPMGLFDTHGLIIVSSRAFVQLCSALRSVVSRHSATRVRSFDLPLRHDLRPRFPLELPNRRNWVTARPTMECGRRKLDARWLIAVRCIAQAGRVGPFFSIKSRSPRSFAALQPRKQKACSQPFGTVPPRWRHDREPDRGSPRVRDY